MSQFFASGGQSIGVSALVSVLPMIIQDGLVASPCSPKDSQESSPTPQFKSIDSSVLSLLYEIPGFPKLAIIFQCSSFFKVQLSQPYMTTGKKR